MEIIKLASDEGRALYEQYKQDLVEQYLNDGLDEIIDQQLIITGVNKLLDMFLWFKDPDIEKTIEEELESDNTQTLVKIDMQLYAGLIYDMIPPALSKHIGEISKIVIMDKSGDYLIVIGEMSDHIKQYIKMLCDITTRPIKQGKHKR